MANWTADQQAANKFKTNKGYINYYNNPGDMLSDSAGRLSPNTEFSAKYISAYDVMQITSCSKKTAAVKKYILSPTSQLSIVKGKASTEAKSGKDKNGKSVPKNTDSDGNESNSDSQEDEVTYVDDAFVNVQYSTTYTDTKQYVDKLSNGLRVKDLRGILGMPHQFMPLTDPRIDSSTSIGDEDGFGRVYSEKIIKYIPLLLMTPGTPSFMAEFSSDQKKSFVSKITGIFKDENDQDLNSITGGSSGKYYSLKYAYTDYFHYVNAMLRSAAYFLGIENEEIDGKKLGSLNWLYSTSTMGSDIFSHGNMANFLGPYAGSIAFYADAGTTVDESFGNSTTESQLSSALNNLSDTGREMNFLVGNVGSEVGLQLTKLTGAEELESNMASVQETIGGLLGSGNVLSNILNKAQTILAGGRIIFPEIWSDSTFSRSYSCSMKLVSPSGDKLSVYLNILVPIYHLLAFTLPRQSVQQAYFSPFLVRAYYKGLFNVDMGIIPGLSITKGEEGEWTLDGIPTVANVTFEIKDLYDGLFMSKQTSNAGYQDLMSNIQELDYIANSCGVNVNDQEVMRTVRMYTALKFGTVNIKDKVTIDIFGSVAQYFNQKMNNIFGVF